MFPCYGENRVTWTLRPSTIPGTRQPANQAMVCPSGSETPPALIYTADFIPAKHFAPNAVLWALLLVVACLICRRVTYLVRANYSPRSPKISSLRFCLLGLRISTSDSSYWKQQFHPIFRVKMFDPIIPPNIWLRSREKAEEFDAGGWGLGVQQTNPKGEVLGSQRTAWGSFKDHWPWNSLLSWGHSSIS